MRKQLLLSVATVVTLSFMLGGASAQNLDPQYRKQVPRTAKTATVPGRMATPRVNQAAPRGTPGTSRVATTPAGPRGGGNMGGGHDGGGRRSGGFNGGFGVGLGAAGVLMALPGMIPPAGGQVVDDGSLPPQNQGPRPTQRVANRGPSGVPRANERRMVPDEVVIEIPNTVSPAQVNALQGRFRLTRLESQSFQLTGSTLYRWRVPNGISVPRAVQAIEGDARVASAQPNYLFTLQQNDAPSASEGDPAQYELGKLRLPQAHGVAKGDNVLVAVIDSGIDITHPDLAGSVAQSFDAINQKVATTPMAPHQHGTAIAGLIAAHGKLMGAAPNARLLAVRAFDPAGKSAEGTTFNILKGLDWAAANKARVINMSFAGPADPAIHRSLEAAHKRGIVLVAAAGNAGANSPPLYPAADANVIAVSATDADDHLLEQSNRGSHIAVAAPGSQIMVAIPDGGYEVSSGTSYSAAEVSGVLALMIERRPDLTPNQARATLLATAKDIGAPGRDPLFGAGLADAYAALTAQDAPMAAAMPPVERVSGAR